MYTFVDEEYEVLSGPMNRAEIIRSKNENGRVSGVIAVSLTDLIDGDSISVRDLLIERLVGSEILSYMSIKLVGCSTKGGDQDALIHVSGIPEVKEEVGYQQVTFSLPDWFTFRSTGTFSDGITYMAKRANTFGDYQVSWKPGGDFNTVCENWYTGNEAAYYVGSGQWAILTAGNEAIITISQEDMVEWNRLLTMNRVDFKRERISEDALLWNRRVCFGNGIEAEINVRSGQTNLWAEGILFKNGVDIMCSEPKERLDGDYQLKDKDSDTTFVVKVSG